MSFNQSRGEKSESQQYRKTGRSGNSSNQRSSSGAAGGAGGGKPPPPQSSAGSSTLTANRSFKKPSNGQGGGQSRVGAPNSNTPGTPAPAGAIKQTNPPASRSTRPVPSSQTASGGSDSVAPSTPSKADAPKSFQLQFGIISPCVVNVMQKPARTSSDPPNLDEQKRDQVQHDSFRVVPAIPTPSVSKHQPASKDSGNNKPSATGELHAAPSHAKRDVHPQVPSAAATRVTQKPLHPITGILMPMPFQSQVPIPFGGPNAQIQSQGVPTTSLQMPMPLPVGSGAHVQQQVFVPGLQSHPIQPQGMMSQSQNPSFTTQIGHQMPPQMGNMGIGMSPQYSQQPGKLVSRRKAVKITHPDTHEELRLDKRTYSYKDSGSSGARSHPIAPPQSRPMPPFPPHQISYYPPMQLGYNHSMYFPTTQTAVPLTSTQMSAGPQGPRYTYPGGHKYPEITGVPLISVPGSKDRPTSETNRAKNTKARAKKKRKDIRKADVAGSTFDLYMANKGPEEKQENAIPAESIERSSSIDSKQAHTVETEKDIITTNDDGQIKAEPDDWEDAAELSTPKLKIYGIGKQGRLGSASNNEDGNISKKYSRDFTLTLSEQCTDLPTGFEIGSDIAESLMSVQVGISHLVDCGMYPNVGRNIDRTSGGPRSDHRGNDDEKWNKTYPGGHKYPEITGVPPISVPGSKDSPTSETNRAKNTMARGKKKRKDIRKADAAGSTSDLYMAYKGPKEKQENAIPAESIERSSSIDSKQAHTVEAEKDIVTTNDDGQIKAEPDDWEDAAELSTPKLKTSGIGKQGRLGSASNNEDGNISKKYSRDFLLTLSDQCTDLPTGFEIGPDIAESLMSVQVGISHHVDREMHPNAGRNIDRTSGGPRSDRRGNDDEKWNKTPSSFVSVRDSRLDGGHAGGGFRPGQGGNHGVLRNPRGQAGGQYVGGILSGPAQSHGPQGGMQRSNSDADRWQRATGYHKGLIPSPQTPLQVMHKAEQKYEIRKVSDFEEGKQRQLKAILNKLTPQNFDKLFEQVKEVNIDNAVTLTGVISQIFDKALMEPTFCEMYANFCSHLAAELPDFSEDNEKITFKRLLLNKCQEEFERGEREQAEANRVEEEGEIKCSDEEREAKRIQARRRMLGNIRLIGELYKKKMLTERIMHECIKKLLGQSQNPDEEDIESLCKLMSTIGAMIDHPKAKEHMDAYFDIMTKFSNNMKLSSRVRFMLKDAIDLRKNKWQQRRKVEGPKKIEEVHRDAAQERQAQATRLARGPSMGSSTRRGMDFSPRGSSVLPSPNSQMGGIRGYPTQARGYGQDVRMEERHPYESRTLSVPLSQRPLDDNSITLGPQGGLARGMSVRGHPLMSGVPLVDIPPGDPRRFAAGPNGYSSTSEWTPYPREEVPPRYSAERSAAMPAYDQSNFQERSSFHGNRDLRASDRSMDRSMASSSASVQAPSVAHPNIAPEKTLSEEQLRDMSISAIREFYSANDKEELALCIKELNGPSFYPSMVSIWVTDSFERKDLERDLLAGLLVDLTKPRDSLLSQVHLVKGFESVLATLEDAVNDAPKAAEFLGRILAKIILENVVPLKDVGHLIHEGGDEPGRLLQIGLAAEVLGSILEIIRLEKGESVLNEIRKSSNLRLEDFRPPDPIKMRKLEAFF